jgi:hypothetical protein
MKAVRRIAALVFLGTVIAAGVPLDADPCAGAASCCPAMAMRTASCARGVALAPEMSCCRAPAPPATAPTASLGAAAAAAPPEVADGVLAVAFDPSAVPVFARQAAARSRAERRHQLGLFTLHSVYRI